MPLPNDAAPLTLADLLQAEEGLSQPRPRRPWMPEVGAGGYGMPHLPRLPRRPRGQMRSANEFALSDYIAEMTGSPLAGVIVDKTAKLGRATGDTLAGATMMPWAYDVGSELGRSAAETDFAGMVTPGSAHAEGASILDQLLAQQTALTRQRAAAQAERDAQAKGDPAKGIKAGRGPNYDKSVAEVERIDRQLEAIGKQIDAERYNRSPEGILKAERERKAFEEGERAKEYGKPIREYLPPVVANSIPVMATALGALATRGMTGRFNREYQRALEGYRAAEAQGNVAEMALRRAQLAELERPALSKTLTTAAAAGLPAEVRLAETVIDANRDPNSRASKEAWARIHDPMAMTFDAGTALLSSGVAYGLGSKFAPNQPDRSLGKAIIGEPYKNALGLADDLATAREAGAALRSEGLPRPSPASAAPPTVPAALPLPAPPGQSPGPGPSPNPRGPSLSQVLKQLDIANSNRRHHSNFQPRGQKANPGAFKKGKPEYPEDEK
jgi:hypothetical protein